MQSTILHLGATFKIASLDADDVDNDVDASLVALDEVDQVVGGRVVRRNRLVVGKLGLDGLGELLPELNTEKILSVQRLLKLKAAGSLVIN